MKTVFVVLLLALPIALAPAAFAGFDTFPVCHDKDVRTGVVNVHVGVDCYPGIWVDVCTPACYRYEVVLS